MAIWLLIHGRSQENRLSNNPERIETIRERYVGEAAVAWTDRLRSTWDFLPRGTPRISSSLRFLNWYLDRQRSLITLLHTTKKCLRTSRIGLIRHEHVMRYIRPIISADVRRYLEKKWADTHLHQYAHHNHYYGYLRTGFHNGTGSLDYETIWSGWLGFCPQRQILQSLLNYSGHCFSNLIWSICL